MDNTFCSSNIQISPKTFFFRRFLYIQKTRKEEYYLIYFILRIVWLKKEKKVEVGLKKHYDLGA